MKMAANDGGDWSADVTQEGRADVGPGNGANHFPIAAQKLWADTWESGKCKLKTGSSLRICGFKLQRKIASKRHAEPFA